MGMGPVPATKKVLEQAGLSIDQVDAFEPTSRSRSRC